MGSGEPGGETTADTHVRDGAAGSQSGGESGKTLSYAERVEGGDRLPVGFPAWCQESEETGQPQRKTPVLGQSSGNGEA